MSASLQFSTSLDMEIVFIIKSDRCYILGRYKDQILHSPSNKMIVIPSGFQGELGW